jgi:hypothetical protein
VSDKKRQQGGLGAGQVLKGVYNDAIKADPSKLPDYLRWGFPLTAEQLAAWQHTGIAVSAKPGLPEHPGPMRIYWTDQRSRQGRNVRNYRSWHRAAGLCQQCPQPVGPSSVVRCEAHHQHQLAYQRQRRSCTQKSLGTQQGTYPSIPRFTPSPVRVHKGT